MADEDITVGTLFSAFGDASIIKQKSQAGEAFTALFRGIQRDPSKPKCQYSIQARGGFQDGDFYWIIPQQDRDILLAEKPHRTVVNALANHSALGGAGHLAQHSCCSQVGCRSSVNAKIALVFQSPGNDEEDVCLGAGLVATRHIQRGEQIFIKYSGDEDIEDS